MVPKQASYIPIDFERKLSERKVLGEDSPEILRETVLFLLGINLGLRAVDEHYALHHHSSDKPSQLTFERAENGKRCLVYREDFITKTNDGGLKNFKKERKVVWVFPNQDVTKCPVRLVDKYMSLLPPVGKNGKSNFYLRSLEKTNPAQWYSVQVVGKHTLSKVVGKLLKDAQLDGFFSNHSLRRTSTTHLFQAGVDRKVIKEFTGHVSDAIDKYQITSVNQKEELSKIIGGADCNGNVTKTPNLPDPTLELVVSDSSQSKIPIGACSCSKRTVKVSETSQIGEMITNLVSSRKGCNTTIKLEIEFS